MIMYSKKITFLLAGLFLFQTAYSQTADIVLLNGKIFTAEPSQLWVEALAINGNTILATGSTESVQELIVETTKIIDLNGKTVVPGFNDAHEHLAWKTPVGSVIRAGDTGFTGLSSEQVLDSLSRLVKTTPVGNWIEGEYGMLVRDDPTLRRDALDKVAPDHPVFLLSSWGHGLLLNSMAMQALGMSETEEDPIGGLYERDPESNRLTGMIEVYAQWPYWDAYYGAAQEAVVKNLHAYADQAIRLGVTSTQNMCSIMDGKATEQVFRTANLPIRVRLIPMPGTDTNGRRLEQWNQIDTNPAPLTSVSGIKYMVDGTPIEQNAMYSQPYPNRPDWYGRLNFPVDTLRQVLQEALGSERQLMLHVLGDSTLTIVLELMKELADDETWRKKRVRIEHGLCFEKRASWKQVQELGLVVVYTPQFGMGESIPEQDPAITKAPLKSLIEAGIPLAIGTDAVLNPFLNILFLEVHAANPVEGINREQAVIAYTRGSAYAEGLENSKGTLVPGMLADLAVLSQDIFTVPTQELPKTVSELTIIDGKIVHDSTMYSGIKTKDY
jgi:predicted amidohydrolase YtcJ